VCWAKFLKSRKICAILQFAAAIRFAVTAAGSVVIVTIASSSKTRRRPMSHLNEIAARHRPDRWTDIIFVVGAVLLTALSVGSVTTKAAGRVWTVTVLESNLEVVR
jgi:hypothetical protein